MTYKCCPGRCLCARRLGHAQPGSATKPGKLRWRLHHGNRSQGSRAPRTNASDPPRDHRQGIQALPFMRVPNPPWGTGAAMVDTSWSTDGEHTTLRPTRRRQGSRLPPPPSRYSVSATPVDEPSAPVWYPLLRCITGANLTFAANHRRTCLCTPRQGASIMTSESI